MKMLRLICAHSFLRRNAINLLLNEKESVSKMWLSESFLSHVQISEFVYFIKGISYLEQATLTK